MTLADTITNLDGDRIHSASAVDQQAFQRIYDRTARPLWAYLLRVSGRRDLADDLLQETFCRFLARNPKGLDDQQSRSYLFRIATNLLHDRWRSGDEARERDLAEGEAANTPSPEQDQAARLDVHSTMRKLKPRHRQLLWLAYVEGMDHSEIAAATGLSALSIRLLLFRARRRAAEMLQPDTMRKE